MKEGWDKVTLGQIAPYSTPKIDAVELNAHNFISADNMEVDRGGITTSVYAPTKGRATLFEEEDVLVSNIRPYFKKIWQAKFRGGCSNDVFVLRAKKHKVDPVFLYYYLSKQDFFDYMMAGANGTKMPRGNKKAIPKYKINLPPLPTQRKIASILSAYDDLIENNLKRIKLLEEKAQLTYEEWFVRMKFPGHEITPISGETGLPEGWEKKSLGDFLTLNYGKALKADSRIPGSFNVYGSSGVVGTHTNALVKGPGVIVGRKGNVGSLFFEPQDFYPIDTVYYVGTNESLYFSYYNLKSQSFVNNDAAVPGLNRNSAYLKKSFLPSREIQNKFDCLIDKYFKQSENLEKQNKLLKEARDILLPRLMTGMIDVEKMNLETLQPSH